MSIKPPSSQASSKNVGKAGLQRLSVYPRDATAPPISAYMGGHVGEDGRKRHSPYAAYPLSPKAFAGEPTSQGGNRHAHSKN